MSTSRERILAAWAAMAAASRARVAADLATIPDLTDGERERAAAIHLAMLEANADAWSAVSDEREQALSQERVEIALKVLGAINGGPNATEDEQRGLAGVTRDELDQAQGLWAEITAAAVPERNRMAAQMVYLAQHAPGLPIGEAIDALTVEELAEYNALTGEDL